MTLWVRFHAGWRRTVPKTPFWRRDESLAALLAATAGTFYLGGDFVWDDSVLIAHELVRYDAGDLVELWTRPIRDEGPGAAYYRPVSLTFLSILGRAGPGMIHTVALLLHAASAFMLTRLLAAHRWPLAAGLLFAVHPMASEVLAWCSALPDLLAVFFGLLAVSLWNRSALFAVFALFLGCLSKETAALIPLTFGAAGMLGRRWWVMWLIPCVFVGALRVGAGTSIADGWIDKWSLAPDAIAWSVGGMVWPFPLSAVRDLWVLPSFMFPLSGAVVLGLVWWARHNRLALTGVALCLAAPALALPVVLDGYLVAERYMYIATVGLGLWVGAVLPPMQKQYWLALPVSGLLLVHGVRSQDWKTDESLFRSATDAYPGSSYSWHFFGVALAKNNKMSAAADAFAQSVAQGHPHPLDRYLCLKALVLAGRGEDAVRWASEGLNEDLTADEVAWRARAAMLVGDDDRARSLFEVLKVGDGYDGPEWVEGAVEDLRQDISNRSVFNP